MTDKQKKMAFVTARNVHVLYTELGTWGFTGDDLKNRNANFYVKTQVPSSEYNYSNDNNIIIVHD